MVQRVIAVGKETATPTGIHAMDAEDAARRAEQGMQFIAIASDLRFMTLAAQAAVATVKPDRGAEDVARY